MKTFTSLTVAILFSASAVAQSTAPAASPTASASAANTAPMKDMAQAEVRKVDKEAKKVTLKHGPIKNLDMPSMTMVFQVRDAALFDKLVVGDNILFTAEQLQGAYVVTGAEKATAK